VKQSNPNSSFGTQLSAAAQSSSGSTPDDFLDAEVIDNDNPNEKEKDVSLFPRRKGKQHAVLQKIRSKIQTFFRALVMMLQNVGQRYSTWARGPRKFLATAALAVSLCFSTMQMTGTSFHHTALVNEGNSATPIERVVVTPSSSITTTTTPSLLTDQQSSIAVVRGGGSGAQKTVSTLSEVEKATQRTLKDAVMDLQDYMVGPKSDTLILLLATALVTPICKRLGTSPILGFLASGMLLGPNGCGLISGIHTTETLAELGIVFFLFEMGIELSVERLMQMRKDVFGLGLGQFGLTALAIGLLGRLFGLPANAQVVLGGGLALSSSAFVLQLLKDKNQLATRFGKASFGILLFQDLAVVPLLVVTPILAGSGSGLARAVGAAVVKAAMALGSIAVAGRYLLNPLFKLVATAQSQEAFLGLVLLTVLSMSFMTEGLGLSNTLGAFLAGVLLSETKYRYQVEADIAPFRGVLLGLFFVTVGFEIDLTLIAAKLPLVAGLVTGIMLLKAAVTTALSLAFGLSLPNSLQSGLILSQGGEFAFVAFGLARSLGILDPATTKLMLTSVSLTMALTPLMASVGGTIAKKLEEKTDFTHYLGQDRDANEIKDSEDFAVVVGYGAVGKIVCNLLDQKLIKYVGLEIDPNKAIQARNAGLPVFFGDVARQEVADAFNVGKAKMVIVCIADKSQANRVLIALRRFYPDVRIFSRAVDADHASRLQNTLNVAAMVPILPEDNLLLTLPFGGAVMKALGVSPEEVNAILESKRKEVIQNRGLDEQEEEAALVQLGIITPRKPPPVIPAADAIPTNATSVTKEEEEEEMENEEWDEEWDREEMDKVAAERRKQAMEKSPFVAEVIEDICPGIAEKPGQNKTTAELLVEAQLAVQDSLPNATEVVSESATNN
jgi:monovalent cation:proton antiporter-2 (CPA2) family protein